MNQEEVKNIRETTETKKIQSSPLDIDNEYIKIKRDVWELLVDTIN